MISLDNNEPIHIKPGDILNFKQNSTGNHFIETTPLNGMYGITDPLNRAFDTSSAIDDAILHGTAFGKLYHPYQPKEFTMGTEFTFETTNFTIQFTGVPRIKKVIFNNPATIVFWSDNTKTVVKCGNENYDPEKGLAMAISKKALGNEHDYYETFKKYLGRKEK